MLSRRFSNLGLLAALAAMAQPVGPHVVSVEPAPAVRVKRGGEADIPLQLVIRSGYHINSNTPAEEYLVPTVVTWGPGPLTVRNVVYPKAESVKYDFSEKPMLVYSNRIKIISRVSVGANSVPGETRLTGKFRYQACTDKMCLPPRTLDVSVPVIVE